MYDSFSDSEEELGLLRKALDVELPSDFDPNKIPQNGEEYIQHVMYETKHCKKLVVANIDKSKLKKTTYTVKVREDCKKAPKSMVPTLEWQEDRLSDFTQFTKYLSTIINEDSTDDNFNDAVLNDTLETTTPKLSVVAKLGQGAKIRLLQRIIEILQDVVPGRSIGRELGAWIYSILATFEIPLTPDACHCLRELARTCSVIRGDLSLNCPEELYNPLNLFICIVARYFKQLDLADDENDL